MKTIRLLLSALLFVFSAHAQPHAGIQVKLDTFAAKKPGGIAVAWVDTEGVAFFQAGKFDTYDPRPITPNTQFEIASITKVFTALLLTESERHGKMDRFDPVTKFLLPAHDPAHDILAKITLHSLATHTSGLSRNPINKGPNANQGSDLYSQAALIAAMRMEGPTAPVGRRVVYSNQRVDTPERARTTQGHADDRRGDPHRGWSMAHDVPLHPAR